VCIVIAFILMTLSSKGQNNSPFLSLRFQENGQFVDPKVDLRIDNNEAESSFFVFQKASSSEEQSHRRLIKHSKFLKCHSTGFHVSYIMPNPETPQKLNYQLGVGGYPFLLEEEAWVSDREVMSFSLMPHLKKQGFRFESIDLHFTGRANENIVLVRSYFQGIESQLDTIHLAKGMHIESISIEGEGADVVELQALKGGFAMATAKINNHGETEFLLNKFGLQQVNNLTVEVVDQLGNPLKGVQLLDVRNDNRLLGVTDAEGKYSSFFAFDYLHEIKFVSSSNSSETSEHVKRFYVSSFNSESHLRIIMEPIEKASTEVSQSFQ